MCYESCVYVNDNDKIYCLVMDGSYCRVCIKKCYWIQYYNFFYIFKYEMVNEMRNLEKFFKRYVEVILGKKNVEGMIKNLENFFMDVYIKVLI